MSANAAVTTLLELRVRVQLLMAPPGVHPSQLTKVEVAAGVATRVRVVAAAEMGNEKVQG